MLRPLPLALRAATPFLFLLLTPSAYAGTLFVDVGLSSGLGDGSSWANAFQGPDGLQNALGVAASGDQIFVKQGTYKPTSAGTRTVSFRLKSGVELYGGFLGSESTPAERPALGAAPTILSGDLAGNDGSGIRTDNSYHVVHGAGTNATALLDGFTISGGNGNGAGSNNKGGGILCINGSSPTVKNCTFIDNRCTFGGGAGYINSSAPSFTDCSFEDNLGGLYGGAFDIATAGAVRFDRCLFRGNRAGRAGALEIFSTNGPLVSNCIFVGNTATGSAGGGALWIGSGGNTQVRNCTIVGNTATNQNVGGLRVQGAAGVSVANCILWDNQGGAGTQNPINQVGGTSNVTYSAVEGGLSGTGNTGVSPAFVNVAAGDYSLAAGSSAIDAGNNAAVPSGITLDYASNPRFVDDGSTPDSGAGTAPIVDMGALEASGVQTMTAFCFGDGTGTACPCGNAGAAGSGCGNATYATGARLMATGTPSISNDTLSLIVAASTPGQPGLFFVADNAINGGAGVAFGDGLRCAGGQVCRAEVVTGDFFGDLSSSVSFASTCGASAGDIKRIQWWYRDPGASPCGSSFNLSNGLEVTWLP